MSLWSDDDSRDLDQRIKAMRKSQPPPRPAITQADTRKVLGYTVTAVDDSTWLMSRGQRRVLKERFEQAQLKRQLEAAGVAVPEDHTLEPPMPPPRECLDCGADISQRGPRAVRCIEHAKVHASTTRQEKD